MTEANLEPSAPQTKSNQKSKSSKEKLLNLTKHRSQLNAILVTFVVIILAVFFGTQLVMKTGVFHPTGKLILDESLTEANRDFLANNLANLELAQDVTIARGESTSYPVFYDCPQSIDIKCDRPKTLLYNTLIPVTDFNSPEISISASQIHNYQLKTIWDITPTDRILAIDDYSGNNYYLDNFLSTSNPKTLQLGALFEFFELTGAEEDVNKVITELSDKIAKNPTSEDILTLAQTGVTALSRRMYSKLNQVQDASYFAAKISDFLSKFDLTHTSNEASFSNLANSSNICAAPDMINTLTAIGLDIVELTGNHNLDCGDEDAIATITKYQELGIKTYGGGVSAEAAAIPLEIASKGNNITMLAYNLSTGGYTTDDTPGANFYTEEKAKLDIATAKARGDTIIVDVQYYECNEYADTNENTICDAADSAAGDQVGFFRHLADLGADIVVGTAAHQPQTYELYHDTEIYYGLGNLFFDQSAWPGTTRSLVLVHYFYKNQLIQTRIVPTIYDDNFQTEVMSVSEATKFLARLLKVQPTQPDQPTQSTQPNQPAESAPSDDTSPNHSTNQTLSE